MNRIVHSTLVLLAGAASVAGLASCGDSTSPGSARGTGTVVVQLTDAPFATDSVKSVDVFVVRIDGRQADADSTETEKGAAEDTASSGGWVTLAKPNATINLLDYQSGKAATLGQKALTAGTYQGFRLVIDPSQSSITLKNGLKLTSTSTPSVAFPSASRSGLKIQLSQPVVVAAGGTTTMLVDFDVANSFVMRGNSLSQNGLLFKPVIRATVTK